MLMNQVVISQVEAPADRVVVDREKVCPMLLRIFLSEGRHNKTNDFNRGNLPQSGTKCCELQIYTWMDCTLRELMGLIKDVNKDCRRKGTEFRFAIIFPEERYDRFDLREVGTTITGQKGPDDDKTLAQCRFDVGDYIDVALIPPGYAANNGGSGGGGRGLLSRNGLASSSSGWGNTGFASSGRGGGDFGDGRGSGGFSSSRNSYQRGSGGGGRYRD